MRTLLAITVGAAIVALASSPVLVSAQAKTASECRAEWQAGKAKYERPRITERAYVARCRGGGSAAPRGAQAAEKSGTPAGPAWCPMAGVC
jgi:hypothetical protein